MVLNAADATHNDLDPQPRHTSDHQAEVSLVERLRAGDHAAFDEMVRRHSDHLMAVARRYLSQHADAEDAVQEALLKAFTCIHQFKQESQLSTWLHRITVNAALMSGRSRARRREILAGDDASIVSGTHPSTPSNTRQDHTHAAEPDDARLLLDQIREMPECHRSVLELRFVQHRGTADAARELGITPSALKTKLHRAKSGLHRSVSEDARLAHLLG